MRRLPVEEGTFCVGEVLKRQCGGGDLEGYRTRLAAPSPAGWPWSRVRPRAWGRARQAAGPRGRGRRGQRPARLDPLRALRTRSAASPRPATRATPAGALAGLGCGRGRGQPRRARREPRLHDHGALPWITTRRTGGRSSTPTSGGPFTWCRPCFRTCAPRGAGASSLSRASGGSPAGPAPRHTPRRRPDWSPSSRPWVASSRPWGSSSTPSHRASRTPPQLEGRRQDAGTTLDEMHGGMPRHPARAHRHRRRDGCCGGTPGRLPDVGHGRQVVQANGGATRARA